MYFCLSVVGHISWREKYKYLFTPDMEPTIEQSNHATKFQFSEAMKLLGKGEWLLKGAHISKRQVPCQKDQPSMGEDSRNLEAMRSLLVLLAALKIRVSFPQLFSQLL